MKYIYNKTSFAYQPIL